jgi:carnitine-CoA ligase
VEVPINVELRGAGLAYQIEQSDSVALIVEVARSSPVLDIIESLGKVRHFIWVARDGAHDELPLLPRGNQLWMTELQSASSDPPDVKVRYNDLATILYTSGTTGRSKGVMMSHHYWYEIWAQSVQYARYTDQDVLYSGLPLFHGNAQGITVGSSLLADARAVIVPRFSRADSGRTADVGTALKRTISAGSFQSC